VPRLAPLSVAAVTVAVAGCRAPPWNGAMPPVAPRQDPCGSGALTGAGATAIHRRPYLQSPRPRGVVVAWAGFPEHAPRVVVAAADDPARAPIARADGRFPGPSDDERARRRELHEEVGDPGDFDAEDFYRLAARIDGLEPGGRYCYRLEDDRGPLTDWATLTLAPPPDPARVDRFVVLGDSGTGAPAQLAIARRVASQPMDAILFLGDIAYRSATHERLQERFFDVYGELFQRVPVYSAIGNHERRNAQGRPFAEAFVLPGNERWYSFELGDVHFVVLDTNQIGRVQAAWLDADLATAARRFTVVLAHHPPFTAARRGPSRAFRRWFVPVLERHRVDLVFSGHEHHYERSRPIGGIVYVVSGGAGGGLTQVGESAHTQVALAVHHFVTLEVHRDRLVVRAIDIDGKTVDQFTVRPRRPR